MEHALQLKYFELFEIDAKLSNLYQTPNHDRLNPRLNYKLSVERKGLLVRKRSLESQIAEHIINEFRYNG